MDNFPPEILLNVFSWICTDTGQTNGTLSLVSKRFRDVSSLIRFERTLLRNVPRMRHFLQMLREMPSIPIVHHLFLYDGGVNEGSKSGDTPIDVCTSIISLLAPTLVTLAGDLRKIGFTYNSLFPSTISFPLLRDLNLGCQRASEIDDTVYPHVPNLRRLHKFNRPSTTEEHIADLNFIMDHAPLVTHVRISNIDEASALPPVLDAALTHNSDKPPALRLPKGMKRLIVQGAIVWSFSCFDTDSDEEQEHLMVALRAVAKKHREDGILVVPEWGRYDVRDCESDWRDVMNQVGDGCWQIPVKNTYSLDEFKDTCSKFPFFD